MKDFDSLSKMFDYISKNTKFALQETAYEIEKVLKDYIMKNWYNRSGFDANNSYFTRTYDYLNSVTVDKVKEISKGEYSVLIYFDTDKIRPRGADGAGRWSIHQSITTGTDVSVMIPYFVEFGQNSPIYSYDGVSPVGDTIEFLERTAFHVREIMKILKKRGIRVEIG